MGLLDYLFGYRELCHGEVFARLIARSSFATNGSCFACKKTADRETPKSACERGRLGYVIFYM